MFSLGKDANPKGTPVSETTISNSYYTVDSDSKNLARDLALYDHLDFKYLELIDSDGVNEAGEAVQKYKLVFKDTSEPDIATA